MLQILHKEIEGINYIQIDSDYEISWESYEGEQGLICKTPWIGTWPYRCICEGNPFLDGCWHNGGTVCRCGISWDMDWGEESFLEQKDHSEKNFVKFIAKIVNGKMKKISSKEG